VEEKPIIEVQQIGHLGIIAAIAKKYKLVEIIDQLLPKNGNNQNLSHGQVVLAMIYQALGLSNDRIYLAEKFFNNLPLEKLFNRGVCAQDFKKDSFARTLDSIHYYGETKFFMDIGFKILVEHNLLTKFAHLDSTSISFSNKKKKSFGAVEITHGHSKDHRSDLPQLVQLLVTTNSGLPCWSETFSGNTSDKDIFEKVIMKVQNYIRDSAIDHKFIYVADSALYTLKFLLNKEITGDWITRVPESISRAREIVERNFDSILWHKINDDYKIMELIESYGGKTQRWILVRNRKAKYKELATLKKNLEKQEKNIEKKLEKTSSKVFQSKEEISLVLQTIKENFKCFIFEKKIKGFYKKQRGQHRRVLIGFKVEITCKRNGPMIKRIENRKGRFILATNIIEEEKLTAKEILNAYRGQTMNIETCFKFIKDKTYRLNSITQTRPERIEAMMPVISLILLLNNLGQMQLREELADKNKTVPNQIGKEIKNPTLKWAFQLLKKISKSTVQICGKIYEQFNEIHEVQRLIIEAFGTHAKGIYGFT
jgi:transposase